MGKGGLFLRKLRSEVSDTPTGFVWVESGVLAGSGYPASIGQLRWVEMQGIGAVLSLTESPLPEEFRTSVPLEYGHVPLPDHGVPSPSDLKKGVDFIVEQRTRGRAVLVHCLAGEGRTGCVLAAYEMTTNSLSAEKALALIRKSKPSFVESRQEKALTDFEKEQNNKPT